MRYIDYYATDGWDSDETKLFLSDGAEQKKIIAWCKKNPRDDLAERENSRLKPDNVAPCEGWEGSLTAVIFAYSNTGELSEWDIASNEQRKAHTEKVARLARNLAAALTEEPHPHYPPVIRLLDENFVQEIVNLIPEKERKYLTVGDGSPYTILGLYTRSQRHYLPTMLGKLADHAEKELRKEKRIARPNTGHPNSRAFALYLAEQFKRIFNRTPNEVIAACVCLKYPELENPPNADTIRDWRGVK